MDLTIEIDEGSGFCFGVTTAIRKAEEELAGGRQLYCLGDIVHNGSECERLSALGLQTIYATARANRIDIIDATCPVVLQLQRRIKRVADQEPDAQVVIYGKPGHAEVIGLVGQTAGRAIVIERPEDVERLDLTRDVRLFSQTTQPLEGFRRIVDYISAHIQQPATFRPFDTICRQVANRLPAIRAFAARHDVILFVCGLKSSNGRVLFEACRAVNPRSHLVDAPESICFDWFRDARSVGICGATSTPTWLMEACREAILR